MIAHSPIVFDRVSYTYPAGEGEEAREPALHNLSLTIEPGSRVALVGESGAGKSTVAALLLRLLEPDGGTIRVAGVPLHELDADTWRRQIAWVPQRPYLFHASVADNIRLGRPHLPLTAVQQAAEAAHAAEFIAALPQGYDTIIGERGNRLSGGQAQRLALARAFLQDAPILILDEATAHLDPEHDRLVRATLDRLMQGRTVLLIAHRLDTIAHADQIVVLDRGCIAESGPGAALLVGPGAYRDLVAAYGGSW
jgi:ABC-type multidrug transport system fused ATPase/permease subunit